MNRDQSATEIVQIALRCLQRIRDRKEVQEVRLEVTYYPNAWILDVFNEKQEKLDFLDSFVFNPYVFNFLED